MYKILKKYILEIVLVVILLGILIDTFWPKTSNTAPEPVKLPWASDAESLPPLSGTTATSPADTSPGRWAPVPDVANTHDEQRTNISSSIRLENHDTPFRFTVYHLGKPLLPRARLLDIVDLHDSLWFSSDSGLIEFNPDTGQWWLRNPDTGLPGDSAYDIGYQDNRLLLDIKNWKNNGKYDYLTNVGHYWFLPESGQYVKTGSSIEDTLVGQHLTTENSDLLHNRISDAVHVNGRVWITSHGSFDREQRDFHGGGVTMLDPHSRQGRQFTTDDGLAASYCHAITADKSGHIWVVHFKRERGISIYNPDTNQWRTKLTSSNNVALGGVDIAVAGKYILIGQQRGLVIYDPHRDRAFLLNEKLGLPGYIVSDIYVDDRHVWVSAYGYAGNGKGSDRGGLVKFSRQVLDQLPWNRAGSTDSGWP
jgi:ligand-binding sensor domain-containing protein